MKLQSDELADAVNDDRQPVCVSCGQPLDRVKQVQEEVICWIWNQDTRCFLKDTEGGDCDTPYHPACGYADDDLVESGEAADKLGLGY